MTFEEWKRQYRVRMPDDLKAKVYRVLDEHSSGTSPIPTKRKASETRVRSTAVAVAACLVLVGGVYTYASHNASIPNQGVQVGQNQPGQNVGGITWGVPANIAWNGYYYATKGYIHTIGSRLGVAVYPESAKIYRIPGQNPDHAVAVEVDTPNGKYVSAVRVPVGTRTTPIPNNWMTLSAPNLESTIQPGERLTFSGNVFFRELYGSTIRVGIKQRGSHHPQILVTQEFQISENGTINGTFTIPKQISGQQKKTQYLLVFRGISKQYPTATYYFPMTLR